MSADAPPFDPRFLCGWVADPAAVAATLATMPRPVMSAERASIAGTGKGKKALLHLAVKAIMGSFDCFQTAQEIGDCVSHGFGHAVITLACTEIQQGQAEKWAWQIVTEALYGLSRVEIGGGRLWGDGSVGAWAAKALTDFGVIVRGEYPGHDLRTYSGSRARKWGRGGLPDALEAIAREHPVKTASLVESYEDARDAIANGYPVAVCSGYGFTSTRDDEGFCRRRGSWAHCMAFIAMDDEHKRPGLLCQNSWGPNWVSGPKRHDQPDGSFWVDADVADRMLGAGDSFALSGFDGFPAQTLDYTLV